jgi:hypothetical protein
MKINIIGRQLNVYEDTKEMIAENEGNIASISHSIDNEKNAIENRRSNIDKLTSELEEKNSEHEALSSATKACEARAASLEGDIAVALEDIRVLEPAFLDGKLYFLASADEGNDLIRVDLESGEEECVQSGLSDRYWLMNDGVYYFRFEVRTINYRSPISSLIGDDRVADSASLYYYGFDEKKETVVYKNEDIAPCYPSGMVIAGTKVCGYFCGNFPALGLERAKVLISIDLESGEITALDETGLQSVTEDETTETNYLDGLKIDYPVSSYPLYGPAGVLSYEEVYEIISNYLKDDADLTYTYSVRCYMKADGAYAVMIDSSGWLYTQALRHVDVAGYTFLFPDGQRMYIYKDGVFYRLAEAYARDIISKEDVAAIQWSKTPIAD